MTPRLARLADRLAAYRPRTAEGGSSLRWAAVAVVLAEATESLLLIRRAERVGDPWSGHMALPGGRRSPVDPELLATAIRETEEEVGIGLERSGLLGTLDDLAPMSPVLPPIAVRPFVFLVPAEQPVALNAEVAAAAWVPIDTILHPDTYGTVTLHLRGEDRTVQAYQFEQSVVWGLTERVLTMLVEQLRS